MPVSCLSGAGAVRHLGLNFEKRGRYPLLIFKPICVPNSLERLVAKILDANATIDKSVATASWRR